MNFDTPSPPCHNFAFHTVKKACVLAWCLSPVTQLSAGFENDQTLPMVCVGMMFFEAL